jgi:hypothetical protein
MSVLPPDVVGKTILIDLPSNDTFSCAAAGWASAKQAVTASADRKGVFIRRLPLSSLLPQSLEKEIPTFKAQPCRRRHLCFWGGAAENARAA